MNFYWSKKIDILIPLVWLSMNRMLDYLKKKKICNKQQVYCIAQGTIVNIITYNGK